MINIEILTLIKEVTPIIATVIGVLIAIVGLSTWRRQLKGQTEYNLSKNLLIYLFQYRDEINNLRHPLMTTGEISQPSEEMAETMTPEQWFFYGTSNAYQARWDKVKDKRNILYVNILESEALWGDELKKLFEVLFTFEHELFLSIQNHLTLKNPETDIGTKNAIREVNQLIRETIFAHPDEKMDEFKKKFKNTIEEIEKYLKKKLVH